MKKYFIRALSLAAVVALSVAMFAPAASAAALKKVHIKNASDIEPGAYQVITTPYPVPFVLLEKTGIPYDFKLANSGRDYKVSPTLLDQSHAFEAAKAVLEKDPHVTRTDITAIKAPDGTIIGYEITPVYKPLYFGSMGEAGLARPSYEIKGSKVLAHLNLDPWLSYNKMGAG